jgi:hypothetical protein
MVMHIGKACDLIRHGLLFDVILYMRCALHVAWRELYINVATNKSKEYGGRYKTIDLL